MHPETCELLTDCGPPHDSGCGCAASGAAGLVPVNRCYGRMRQVKDPPDATRNETPIGECLAGSRRYSDLRPALVPAQAVTDSGRLAVPLRQEE